MAPHQGLVHPKEYDIKDSNVELIGSDIDHRVKHKSAATEPAWNDGHVGARPGLRVWRIEDFQVVPWPQARHGEFYDGDSYIVLHSYRVGSADSSKLGHDIFFWLGAHTTQDEAGTAAYKTVELDEFLHGAATQHREVQSSPSNEFLALFPRVSIRRGGVRSGFRHVEQDGENAKEPIRTLLRVFRPGAAPSVVVHEVAPTWESLDDGDVFVLDTGESKIWVWQGVGCNPMEKAKAAQVVHDMTLAKHVDVEVVAQAESRSRRVVTLLGGTDETPTSGFKQPRPIASAGTRSASSTAASSSPARPRRLFRLSDASGQLSFDLVKDGGRISTADLDGDDVFLLDDAGRTVWVWEGSGASREEKSRWLAVAQAYIRHVRDEAQDAHLVPLAKVSQGNESRAFMKAIEAN
ncbi:hypothetical protein JDV02_002977 [Purpureocillium takamizusanense]|uniref:Gelsolin-like domain-containing protein n=1 Tax=Purpureocillium takamizusanense TaxID=2060973 RepID=A0A9Q8V9C9_9HYPO|nr:uncharacterized protein JDV02_002977 [Purpureocillium takamizusanense]UNI16551.1 hypothetical protein JDV02_002977 [Purpureocillium takamizusanense]